MSTFSDNDIVSPEIYADEAKLHAMFAKLRREEPVRWTAPDEYRPFWALSKHSDIFEVERRNDIFKVGPRNRLMTIEEEKRISAETGGSRLIHTLPAMDDPEHAKFRGLTRNWFMPGNLKKLELKIAELANFYIDQLESGDSPIDFVKTVSLRLPLSVIMLILGIPEEHGDMLHRLTGELFSPHDPDTARPTDGHATAEAAKEFFNFYRQLVLERRKNPGDDLVSVIANATIDGSPISEHDALSYCVSITAAGHDTTAYSIAGGLHALILNPDQYKKLRVNPDLITSAVEEIVRYVAPVRNFMRVANEDYELRGKTIKAGQAVLSLFPSACRDEDVFENSNAFMVDRAPQANLAFGAGVHACLGMMLARMEIKHFFSAFISRVERPELAGETTWMRANFLGGPKKMPICCHFSANSTLQSTTV
jgi:cytochrome P450